MPNSIHLIENNNIDNDKLVKYIDKTVEGIKNKFSDANRSSQFYPDSFYDASLRMRALESLLFKEFSSEPFRMSVNLQNLIDFLNITIRNGSQDLLRLGSEKKYIDYIN